MVLISLAQAQPHLHSSGLRSELIADTTAPTVDIAMAVAVGEADDPVGAEGMAHGVEHLWFELVVDGERISTRLAALGCASNAFTGGEWMVFVESCPAAALEAVLDLEVARFRPWTIPTSAEREWRVIAQEELGRAEIGAVIEGDMLRRQLLPASHPIRLRATRPHHAPFPGVPALEAFIAARMRPDRAALVITGPITTDKLQATLDQRFGASAAATTIAPLRTPPTPRTVLRMAPRTVPGIALTPVVHVGWAQPAPSGMGSAVLDLYIERGLRAALELDPRVASVDCGHEDVLFTRTFDCVFRTVDDAAAGSLAAELPGILRLLTPDRTAPWFLELTMAQATLWSAFLSERHVAEIGSLAAWRARELIEGVAALGAGVDLRTWAASALLADTALILALPGDGNVRVDFPRPAPAADVKLAEPSLPPLPAPSAPIEATVRTLDNGLELIAARRSDATLVHAALSAEVAADPTASTAVFGLYDSSRMQGEVIDVDLALGTWVTHHVATLPRLGPSAAQRLANRLGGLAWDPRIEARSRTAIRTTRRARGAAVWAWLVPRLALGDEAATRDAGVLSPAAGAEALGRLLSPTRARLVVVGPAPIEEAVAPLVERWSAWRGSSAGTAEAVALTVPKHARIDAAGVQARVGLQCPLPSDGAAGALAAEVVEDALVREIRDRRGRGYHLSASGVSGALEVQVATDPEWAAEALGIVLAALTTPSPSALRAAQVAVLGAGSPARWAPDTLTDILVSGALTAPALQGWDEAARGRTAAQVGADLAACSTGAAWAVAGPEGTGFPAEAEPFDPKQLEGLILR